MTVTRYGRPGVEFYGEHDEEQKVTRIAFLPGQGRLVTLTEDNYLHLWEINGTSIKVNFDCRHTILQNVFQL